jgi:hypothetical protein
VLPSHCNAYHSDIWMFTKGPHDCEASCTKIHFKNPSFVQHTYKTQRFSVLSVLWFLFWNRIIFSQNYTCRTVVLCFYNLVFCWRRSMRIWLEQVLCIPLRIVRGECMGRSFGWDRKNRGPVSRQRSLRSMALSAEYTQLDIKIFYCLCLGNFWELQKVDNVNQFSFIVEQRLLKVHQNVFWIKKLLMHFIYKGILGNDYLVRKSQCHVNIGFPHILWVLKMEGTKTYPKLNTNAYIATEGK